MHKYPKNSVPTREETLEKVQKAIHALERVPGSRSVHEMHGLLKDWEEFLLRVEKDSVTNSAEIS